MSETEKTAERFALAQLAGDYCGGSRELSELRLRDGLPAWKARPGIETRPAVKAKRVVVVPEGDE